MSRAARAVECARPGRDENVPVYCRFEIDKAIPRPHWPFQKNSCFPRARADEMFASRFLPRSPPGQDRCAALWAPKRESAFRSHRLVPPRSDIGGRCVLESRQSFVRQLRVGSALRRFLFSSLTSTIKTQLAKCDGGYRQDAAPNLCSDFFNLTQNRCTYSDRLESRLNSK